MAENCLMQLDYFTERLKERLEGVPEYVLCIWEFTLEYPVSGGLRI